MTLFKLGLNNVKHNFKNYVSYFISTLASVFILMTFYSIYYNREIQTFSSGKVKVAAVFKAASLIVIVFSAIFICYANSFFIKNKKKEVALYSILGMKKKEIGTLMFFENIFLGVLALIIGVPLGAFTSSFFLKLLAICIKSDTAIKYILDIRAIAMTIFVFMIIFLINSIKAYNIIYKFQLIELIHAEKDGEEEPEYSKEQALLSLILIGTGYFIAFKVKLTGGTQMIYDALIIIILVISGTYILFNNLIIYIFKIFQRNKKVYYKGENLIGVSQIVYRIKGNSNLLATISVISAVAITALCFTFSFYMTLNGVSKSACPFSIMYKSSDKALNKRVEAAISESKENKITYKKDITLIDGSGLTQKYKGPYGRDLGRPFGMFIMSASDYNDIIENSLLSKQDFKSIKIDKDDQCYFIELSTLSSGRGRLAGDKLDADIGGKSYKFNITSSDIKSILGNNFAKTTIVVSDAFFKQLENDSNNSLTVIRAYNFDNQLKNKKLDSKLSKIVGDEGAFSSYYSVYTVIYRMYGSYIFIGAFLGILFVASTGSMLYYKQIIEGFEDKGRYSILSKIGLNKKETFRIVVKQLGFIFVMPLLFAILDSAVALKMYVKYCGGMTGSSMGYIIECICGMMGIYVLIYLFYYFLSVKSYMKIVSGSHMSYEF